MTKYRLDKDKKKKIVLVLKKHNIKRAGIFGSYARGEAKKSSDMDSLIEFNESLYTPCKEN